MSEDRLTGPKRWIATPALCWLVFLNAIFLLGPYVAAEKGTNVLLLGRIPLAGMVGIWVVMGSGTIARRIGVIGLAVGIFSALDSPLNAEVFLVFITIYLVAITGGAMAAIIGNILRKRESNWPRRRPQFSIAEIAGWTAAIAAVLGLTVFVRETEFGMDVTFLLMLLWFQGAFVGIICLPLFAEPGESRGRWIGGAILSGVIFLFVECGAFLVYDLNSSG